MNRQVQFIIGVVLTFSFTCCAGGQGGRKVGKFRSGPMPEGATWTGKYYTNWGEMRLTQTGNSVVGTFGEYNGIIEGTVEGNLLIFHWSQDERGSITAKKRRIEGSGVMQYKVVKRGEVEDHVIEGTWGYGNRREGGGLWRGEKSRKDVKKQMRVKLITKGAATKRTEPLAGGVKKDYIPPPEPAEKYTDEYSDIPPPLPK